MSNKKTMDKSMISKPYLFLSTGIEEVEETDNVAVVKSPHDLKLAVLEPFVLQTLRH